MASDYNVLNKGLDNAVLYDTLLVRCNMSIETLQDIINNSENIVFFGGAGVSTESGLPDFRSVDGLYHQKYKYPPETILSRSFFNRRTLEFFEFYKEKLLCTGVKPNKAHKKLAELEAAGKLRAVITQNIDGLHQMAGSKNVVELHGSVHRNYCMNCGEQYELEFVEQSDGVPMCKCGGVVRPDVVLYEEGLDQSILSLAIRFIADADVLIVGGTSLAVYPAAGLLQYYKGNKLVLINKGQTQADRIARLVVHQPIGETLNWIEV